MLGGKNAVTRDEALQAVGRWDLPRGVRSERQCQDSLAEFLGQHGVAVEKEHKLLNNRQVDLRISGQSWSLYVELKYYLDTPQKLDVAIGQLYMYRAQEALPLVLVACALAAGPITRALCKAVDFFDQPDDESRRIRLVTKALPK